MKNGSYLHKVKSNKYLVEWAKLPLLSDEFADRMQSMAELGTESFLQVELDFIKNQPEAFDQDPTLFPLKGMQSRKLERTMRDRLSQMFYLKPKDFPLEMREQMVEAFYYFVTIKEEKGEEILGFITFLSGGPIPLKEFKITVLAIDPAHRRKGLAKCLVQSIYRVGEEPRRVFLSTRPSNIAAIKLYKKCGFKHDKELEESSPEPFIKNHWIHLSR